MIRCCHCRKLFIPDRRQKGRQRYCSEKACQQARKNKSEHSRLQNDPVYKERRDRQKKEWYKKAPGDRYQAHYRSTHPDYCATNREQQRERNRKGRAAKIVKTDALRKKTDSGQSLRLVFPSDQHHWQKIVKTDALIVRILAPDGIAEGVFIQDSS